MVGKTWSLLFVAFVLPFEIAKAADVNYGEDGPLSFHCQGESNVVALEYMENINTFCGPDFQLFFNGSQTNLSNGKLMFHFASFPNTDYAIPLHHTAIDMTNVNYEWTLQSPQAIDNTDLPCGAGYIIAAVHEYGMIRYAAAQRAVRLCDFSDIDVELEVVGKMPNHTINLIADGSRLMDQLQRQNVTLDRIVVHNNGHRKLENVTMENPQMVLVYIRHNWMEEREAPMCKIPSFTLSDTPIGALKFTDGIEAYGMHEVMEDPSMPINVDFSDKLNVCGETELVLMLDPLGMLNDSNPCNNFVRLNVYMHCVSQEDTCKVVSNPIQSGREAYMMFKELFVPGKKMYKYMVDDKKWMTIDDQKHHTLVERIGFGKFVILNQLLPWVYEKYNHGKFPCEAAMPFIKSRIRFPAMNGYSNYTLDKTRMATLSNLKQRLQSMTPMQSMEDLKNDVEMFGNNTYDILDEAMRMKVMGLSIGLQHAMAMSIMLETMKTMQPGGPPKNLTRTILGPTFEGLASLLWQASVTPPMMRSHMIPPVMQHTAAVFVLIDNDMFTLPDEVRMNVYNICHNVLNYPHDMMTKDTNSSMCNESHMARMAKYLWYLSMGHDGEHEKAVNEETCEDLMVTSYMAHGGAHILAKDILEDVAKDSNTDMAPECRPHPYMPNSNPKAMWHVKDGKVMMGHYSPVGDVVTWKVAALCRCDGCQVNSGSSMYSTTMPTMDYTTMTMG